MEIDPARLSHAERYKLMIGCIVPRPIAWVSTLSPDGRPNLAPFSFFAGVGATPMTLLFCPANNDSGNEKDSLRNARPPGQGGIGQFVVNVVTHDLARRMAACAEPLPYGQSEWDLAGLTSEPSARVRPARVAGSPAAFECVTRSVTSLAPGVPGGANIVVGEVVHVYVRDGVVNERMHTDAAALDAVGRLGGQGYCTVRDRFELPMGRAALGG